MPPQKKDNKIYDAIGGFFNPIGVDFMKRGQDIINSIHSGADAYQKAQQGKMNPIEAGARLGATGIQTAGSVAGGALDILKEGIGSFAKPIANSFVNSSIGKAITDNKGVQQFASKIGDVTDKLGKQYTDLKAKNPETVKTGEALGNIGAVLGLNSAFQNVSKGSPIQQQKPQYDISQAQKQIDNHFTSANQILKDADMKGKVPMNELLDRTKTNIVDDLKRGGASDIAKEVNKLDMSKYPNIDDFNYDVKTILTNKAAENFATHPEAVPLFRGETMASKGGVHFTPDSDWAKQFGKGSVEGSLPPNSKVFKINADSMQEAMNQGITTDEQFYKYLFEKGYDAILGTDSRNGHILDVVVNPKMLSNFKVQAPAYSQ